MQVPKQLAIFGFHFCTTVFIGLCLYGVVRYMSEGLLQSDSIVAAAFYGLVVLASIAGICFFGREADRRKAEEIRAAPQTPPPPASKKKRRS